MKYVGSKNRHAKEILSIILKDRINYTFVDLFCGGCNLIDKVDSSVLRIANDINYHLIEMFKALQKGWIPPDIVTEEEYKVIKTKPQNYPAFLVGFVGFCCSFSGKWWGGYARGNNSLGQSRNYALEAKKNLIKQAQNIKNIQFYNLDYQDVPLPENSIIYCDIPYENTTKYNSKFDYQRFWKWAAETSLKFPLFISEYTAPIGWKCIWSKKVNNTLDLNTGSKQGIERLFKYEAGIN